ncbi:hypothetical protein [Rhodococcus pseudokoreensis]|uniref:hypothetical protein n=1 Tax=Rhodococcus pseudokoreensis TaxID=2811421 RepID=UPI001F127285|nr:hypothetical protein [Rhodococcus pseudokoreensis]
MLIAAAWVLQRKLIYFPDTTPVPPAGRVIAGAEDVTLGLALDVRAGRRHLVDERRVPPERLLYFGESLGTGDLALRAP